MLCGERLGCLDLSFGVAVVPTVAASSIRNIIVARWHPRSRNRTGDVALDHVLSQLDAESEQVQWERSFMGMYFPTSFFEPARGLSNHFVHHVIINRRFDPLTRLFFRQLDLVPGKRDWLGKDFLQ